MKQTALDRAIACVGSAAELGRRCGVKSRSVVQGWKDRGRVPAEYALKVEEACDGAVTCHELRPDLYRKAA